MFNNWSPCEVVASVSAVAVAFAKDRSTDEIAFWGHTCPHLETRLQHMQWFKKLVKEIV